jgi:alginate biosynthesis protein AlgX
MKNILLPAIALILIIVFGVFVYTSTFGENTNDELMQAYCDDMYDPDVYDERNITHYKIMLDGKDNWIFRTENDFRSEWSISDKTINKITKLQDVLNKMNTELYIVMPPVRGMVHADKIKNKYKEKYGLTDNNAIWNAYESMIDKMKKSGVNIVGASQNETPKQFFYEQDHHWRSEGAKFMAQKTAEMIKRESDLYKSLPVIEYETVEAGMHNYDNSYSTAFEKICDTSLEPTPVIEYKTRPKQAAQTSNDLFSDEEEPSVVLLGTSNSVLGSSYANFEGYLKEYLSRDIVNYADIGAGIDTSLIDFLNSNKFRNNRPKIIIWEVPGYYDLNIMDDKVFNQAAPTALGQCSSQNTLMREAIRINNKNTVLFKAGRIKNVNMANESQENNTNAASNDIVFIDQISDLESKYLSLNFRKPVEDRFSVRFQYEDGGVKIQQFNRSDDFTDFKNYYTFFPQNDNKKIINITLDSRNNRLDNFVTGTICDSNL